MTPTNILNRFFTKLQKQINGGTMVLSKSKCWSNWIPIGKKVNERENRERGRKGEKVRKEI